MKYISIILLLVLTAGVCFAQADATVTTEFPNYHPLIVHFPIVFLIIAACMQIGLFFTRSKTYNKVIFIITAAGAVTGWLAGSAFHADIAQDIPPATRAVFEQHEHFASLTLWLSGIATLLKIPGLFARKMQWEIIACIVLIASAVTVCIAGHRGSELVYLKGVGPQGNHVTKEHNE